MVPRQNITSIDLEDVNEIINKIMDSGYSRIPVYKILLTMLLGFSIPKKLSENLSKEKEIWIMKILKT
jgi:CBS domain containing-hemolysin-like protein